MYDTTYLASLFNVSATTIRNALRALGLGVGTTGTYQFGADEIDAVINEISGLLKRSPFNQATPMARGGLVPSGTPLKLSDGAVFISSPSVSGYSAEILAALNAPSASGSVGAPVRSRAERVRNFALDNKTSIIYLLIGLIAAIMGIDLAL